ncbi:MarR family winged helix-turn-helix transcriptional regulator [Thiohalomonas denitrificans]|uniref:MarR family winged helix-turn-helix transcriptional regulator n=1 Tax=Thiohalomonas denitrificans TaxID=415747 RepID=UPI0026EFD40A|nr:helix-turn-helix domain-containing protein [Thiohalomonas denitrificans]
MEQLDVVALIHAAQQLERNTAISLMYSGLKVSQFRLLTFLESAPEPTVTQISKYLKITRASASVMVNELVRAKILSTEEHPVDRRSFLIQITALGESKLTVAHRDLKVLQEKLSEHYATETIQVLNDFAAAITNRKPGGAE